MPFQTHCVSTVILAATVALPGLSSFGTTSIEEQARARSISLDEVRVDTLETLRGKARIKDELARKGAIHLERIPDGTGRLVAARLTRVNVLAEDFALNVVREDGSIDSFSHEELPEIPLYLSGRSDDDAESLVFLAVDDGEPRGFIDSPSGRVLIGDPDWVKAANEARIEEELFAQMKGIQPSCGVISLPDEPPLPQGGLAAAPECYEIPLHLFADNEHLTNVFNGNTGMWYGWMVEMVAATAAIYRNEIGCRMVLGSLWHWNNATDPFNQTSSDTQLDEFQAFCTSAGFASQGNIYGLISGRAFANAAGTGVDAGLATLSGLVNGNPYFLATTTTLTVPSPLVFNNASFPLQVVVHEIGHLLGAKHTHDYCPPIDQCAPADATGAFLGPCQTAQVCQLGTLMSYCSQCPGGATNVQLQFHPQIKVEILAGLLIAPGVTIAQPNPVAVDDDVETMLNEPIDIHVFDNDEPGCKPFAPATFDAVSAQGGSVVLSGSSDLFGDAFFRYKPAPAFIGQDSFTYTLEADDPNGSMATVSITVKPQYHEIDSILIVDTSNDSVVRFDRTQGSYLGTVVPPGYGGVKDIRSITLTPYGNIVLSSHDTNELLYYHGRTGRFLGVYYTDSNYRGPVDVVFDGLRVYAAADNSDNVHAIHLTQGFLGELNDPEIRWPNDLALAGQPGEVWVVVENIEKPVQRWDINTGTMLSYVPGNGNDWPKTVCYYEMPSQSFPPTTIGWYVLVVDRAAWELRLYGATGGSSFGNILPPAYLQALDVSGLGHVHADSNGRVFLSHDNGVLELDPYSWWTPSAFIKATAIDELDTPGDFTFQSKLLRRRGDVNFDSIVNGLDLAIVLSEYGTYGIKGDLDGDGLVDGRDLGILLGDWGAIDDDDDDDEGQEGDG